LFLPAVGKLREAKGCSAVAEPALRVIKVGGSLLDWPPLVPALRRWLACQRPAGNVLLCGGGIWCDALREAQQRFALAEQAVHWLSVDALTVTAGLLAQLLQLPPPETDWQRVGQAARSAYRARCPAVVFDPRVFLYAHEAKLPGSPLPPDGRTTSDSVAARLAEVLGASELVLLKSADPPSEDLGELAAAGYVDMHLARALPRDLPLRLVNLRAWEGVGRPCPPR
jgi:aspartokinase-like uncharacterized kinase